MEKGRMNQELSKAVALIEGVRKRLIEDKPQMPAGDGWRLTGEVTGDKIFVYVWNNGVCVSRGFSNIMPEMAETDLGMVQCFSYAAHMAYKNLQLQHEVGNV